jgi:hypothetical protein
VPAGLIEDQNSVMPGLAGGIAGLRADSTEDVGPLGSLIFGS